MRLDALVSDVLGCSKKEATALVRNGALAVGGRVQREPRWQVVLDEAREVSYKGGPLLSAGSGRPFPHKFLMIHKPERCLCERFRESTAWCAARGIDSSGVRQTPKERAARARGCTSVYDLVPAALNHPDLGLYGRLDVDTTGLILMGTDGGLQQLFMHPASRCEKAYLATLRTEPRYRLRDSAPAAFARGVRLADGHECKPAKLEVVESVMPPRATAADVVPIPHVVKRMLAACGAAVVGLHRERFGGFSLSDYPELTRGQVIVMGDEERRILRAMLPRQRVQLG